MTSNSRKAMWNNTAQLPKQQFSVSLAYGSPLPHKHGLAQMAQGWPAH